VISVSKLQLNEKKGMCFIVLLSRTMLCARSVGGIYHIINQIFFLVTKFVIPCLCLLYRYSASSDETTNQPSLPHCQQQSTCSRSATVCRGTRVREGT